MECNCEGGDGYNEMPHICEQCQLEEDGEAERVVIITAWTGDGTIGPWFVMKKDLRKTVEATLKSGASLTVEPANPEDAHLVDIYPGSTEEYNESRIVRALNEF